MLNPQFLETMNGVLFLVMAAVALKSGHYIWRLRDDGYESPHIQLAIGILSVASGQSMIRGWVWLWRHQANDGVDVHWMNAIPVLPVGIALAIVGGLCLIRVFCRNGWIGVAVVAALVSLYLAL